MNRDFIKRPTRFPFQLYIFMSLLVLCFTDCGNLGSPENGTVSMNGGTSFGHYAVYSCSTGFDLIGNTTRRCAADGYWTGEPAFCQIKSIDKTENNL